jgi:hypothetical protein
VKTHGVDSARLEEQALAWIAPYWNARHLIQTREWLLVLDPEAGDALRLAALTHDMERHFPGGPVNEPGRVAPDDEGYRRAHSERSARIVGDWLRQCTVEDLLVGEVERLVLAHEIGGAADEDLLQAADSISFLETNVELVVSWATEGRCSRERAKAQHSWMFERIKIERARNLARPLYKEAIAAVDAA